MVLKIKFDECFQALILVLAGPSMAHTSTTSEDKDMASAIEMMGEGILRRSNYTPAAAVGMMLADTGVGFGASVALGEVYVRYHDKPWGKWLPEIVGGAGKLLELVATLFLGPGFTSGVLGSVGQTGVNAIGMELGMNHARKALGIVVVKVPTGTDVKKLKSGDAVPASTAVGALGEARPGRGLAWDHISDLAASH